ncbi:hypothetical protein GCM10027033_09520 [Leucobacter ruminantium]
MAGSTDRRIRREVDRRALHLITRGWYVAGDLWKTLTPRSKHLLLLLAVAAVAETAPVFSFASAAAVHGLPLHGLQLDRAHVLVGTHRRSASTGPVKRHTSPFRPEEVVCFAGLACTDLVRTAVDVARSASYESGLLCADAALRRMVLHEPWSVSVLRESMRERLERLPRSHGKRRALRVLAHASAQSESALESLTRLQLERLGFTVLQQVRVVGPRGEELRVDLELVGFGVFVEADGKQKYLDAGMRGERTVEEMLLDEKRREDWVRGVTAYRVIRLGWEDVRSPGALATRLRAFGIEPPRSPDAAPLRELY